MLKAVNHTGNGIAQDFWEDAMPVGLLSESGDLSSYTSFEHAKEMPRHRWYYFKEGFSPLLVEKAIEKADIKKDDLVIDIFSGSGTVPLVSSNANINSIGFEVNPFMVFVSKAKLLRVQQKTFNFYYHTVFSGIREGKKSNIEGYSTFTENKDSEKWLFNKKVIRSFEGGWEATKRLPYEVANLYRLALVSAIMANANVIRDGKCLRYKKNWRESNYSKRDVLNEFEKRCIIIAEDLKHSNLSNKAKIISGDVRKTLRDAKINKFKLCITSPPYLNSFDYSDIYRPELFLCKYVSDNNGLGRLRLNTVRSHVQINWAMPQKKDFGRIYERCFNELVKREELFWNKRIPSMIQAYFEDIENLLIALKEKSDKDAQLWIVVSTSVYAGIEIPVDEIIAEIGERIGWEYDEIINTRNLKNSPQNAIKYNEGIGSAKRLRESIVVLRNRGNSSGGGR
jgi:DNA modification methylase